MANQKPEMPVVADRKYKDRVFRAVFVSGDDSAGLECESGSQPGVNGEMREIAGICAVCGGGQTIP